MITDGRGKGWWPKGADIWVGVMPTSRACGARSSGERPCPDERPCGENPGITWGVVFPWIPPLPTPDFQSEKGLMASVTLL